MDRIAVRSMRGGVAESVHRASLAVTDARGRLVATFGDPRLVTFLRSSVKPFQSLPLVETGAADAFKLTTRELAIATASHNAEVLHVDLVKRVLSKAGVKATALQCGPHPPYQEAAARAVGDRFTSLHNNCSGKHAGMLATCRHMGWDEDTYLEPSHPLQRRILDGFAAEAGVKPSDVLVATDGCGAPNFAVPLREAARAFARFTVGATLKGPHGPAFDRIRGAMMQHPEVVAGDDRPDTRFMRTFGPKLWAKAGGESCYAFGLPEQGVAGVLKIEDGAPRAVPPLLWKVVTALGLPDGSARRAKAVGDDRVRNWAGTVVGQLECDAEIRLVGRARPT